MGFIEDDNVVANFNLICFPSLGVQKVRVGSQDEVGSLLRLSTLVVRTNATTNLSYLLNLLTCLTA